MVAVTGAPAKSPGAPRRSFWDSPSDWWEKSSLREKGLSFLLLAAIGGMSIGIILYGLSYLSFEHLLVAGTALAGIELAVGIYVGLLELEDLEKEDELKVLREILSEIRSLRSAVEVGRSSQSGAVDTPTSRTPSSEAPK